MVAVEIEQKERTRPAPVLESCKMCTVGRVLVYCGSGRLEGSNGGLHVVRELCLTHIHKHLCTDTETMTCCVCACVESDP
jgi:hypothetical protein